MTAWNELPREKLMKRIEKLRQYLTESIDYERAWKQIARAREASYSAEKNELALAQLRKMELRHQGVEEDLRMMLKWFNELFPENA